MMDSTDMGMTQRCQYESFAFEPRHAFRVARKRFRENFDGNLTRGEAGITGAINFAHSPNAQSSRISYEPILVPGLKVTELETDYTFAAPVDPTVCAFVGDQKVLHFSLDLCVTIEAS